MEAPMGADDAEVDVIRRPPQNIECVRVKSFQDAVLGSVLKVPSQFLLTANVLASQAQKPKGCRSDSLCF